MCLYDMKFALAVDVVMRDGARKLGGGGGTSVIHNIFWGSNNGRNDMLMIPLHQR